MLGASLTSHRDRNLNPILPTEWAVTNTMTITSVIWDMDGVLLDTEPIYLEVESSIVSRYGKSIETVLPKLLGRRAPEGAQIVVDDLNLPMTASEYLSERNEQLLKLMPSCEILSGIKETVRHLKANGIPSVIATSSPRDLVMVKKEGKDEFFALFEDIVCGDDVIYGKPHPEIFLTAAKKINAKPENCVVFEDAPAGIHAAVAAGMTSVALPNHKVDIKLYQDESPTYTVPSACILDFDLSVLGFPLLPK